jgi:hypothetical protein
MHECAIVKMDAEDVCNIIALYYLYKKRKQR